MTSWTSLPIDIKKRVVEELDLLTRCRLKICSTSNQKLVNSVPLTIKNARIGLGDDACLLIIHTGIGEFVKLDLEKSKKKVVIKRSINSHDVSKAKTIQTAHKDLLVPLCLFIKSLLASNNTFLNVLEWEYLPLKNEEETVAQMQNLLNRTEFCAKKLMINEETPSTLSQFLTKFCKKKELKAIHRLAVPLDSSESLFPTRLFDMVLPQHLNEHSIETRMTHVFLDRIEDPYSLPELLELMMELIPGSYITARCRFDRPEQKFEQVQAKAERSIDQSHVKRVIQGNLVYRHLLTGCGYSMTVIHKSKENTIDWKSETCGLGMLCADCADPFEYCYFNDLPRRLIHEPNWANIFALYKGEAQDFVRMLTKSVSMEEIMLIKIFEEPVNQGLETAVKKAPTAPPTSWTGLPIDIKKKVVEKLDFLTRCRLKICSTSDRKLVNSVPLTIKNARIGLGDEACLLMVHTGIGEFVKLDLEMIRGRVVIKRSINSYDMSKAKKILTPHTDMYVAALPLMKSLLTSVSNNIHLDVLEWEFNSVSNMIFFLIKKLLNGVKFRVKKLLLSHKFTKSTDLLLSEFCQKKDLKHVQKMSIDPGARCAFPLLVMETCYPNYLLGKTLRFTRVKMFLDRFDYLNTRPFEELLRETHEGVYVTLRLRAANPNALFDKCPSKCLRLTDKTLIKRELLSKSFIALHRLSPCGYSKTVIHRSHEKSVDWVSEPCELGVLCSKCNGQFAFEYLHKTPRRVINEPNWTNVFCNFHDERERQECYSKLKALLSNAPSLKNFDFKNLSPGCTRARDHEPLLNLLKSTLGIRGPGYPSNFDQLAAEALAEFF